MRNLTFIFLALLITLPGIAQTLISGKVTGENKQAIAQVQIIIKSKAIKTQTDNDGRFSILAQENDTLAFSALSYENKEVIVKNKNFLSVTMYKTIFVLEDMEAMEEFVIVAPVIHLNKSVVAAVSKSTRVFQSTANYNTESYSSINENGYKNVYNNPLSTFSIDVDQASYTNIRRFLNQGQLPPVDAVRIEEMINYFSYEYAKPESDKPYSINTELIKCPWNENHQLLMLGLQAMEIDKSKLPPSNLVFLLDVSGSMQSANKLPLVKAAMKMLLNELRPNDRVAIVVYAGAAGVVLNSTSGNNKQTIASAIERLEAGGSTAGGEGIKAAYKIARENFIEDGNNRIILATDGDFNIGISSNSEMELLVEKERDSGIFMTALGFGIGNYKDDKMETIADKGNGNYAYINNLQDAQKVFVKEFGGTLFTVAKDVKLQVEFNPQHVKAYRLIGYENRLLNDEDFNNDKQDAGEMGMGHTVTALYEIIPSGSQEKFTNIDELKYQTNRDKASTNNLDELATIKTRYKLPDGNESYLMSETISHKETPLDKSSNNIRFASSVAGFGMQLRSSEYKGDLSYQSIISLANGTLVSDKDGYRGEFIRLVKLAESIDQAHVNN